MNPPLPPFSPILEIRLEAARRLGCEVELLDPETGYLVELRHGANGSRRRVLQGGISPLNDAMAFLLAGDKYHTAHLLRRAGFRVPRSARCLKPGWFPEEEFSHHTGLEPAQELATALDLPLVVKPNRGSRGKGITVARDAATLEAAVREVWQRDYLALVQEVIPGIDVRLDFLDDDYLLGYARRPVRLVGDGEHTLGVLLQREDPRFAGPDFEQRLAREPLWPRDLDLETILPEGSVLDFSTPILNLNRLCLAEPVQPLPAPWREAAQRIAKALNLRHYGIDFKVESLAAGPDAATVIEVNASPSVVQMAKMGHRERALAAEEKVVRAILGLDP